MKITVTTASGQLGRAVIEACIELVGKESVLGLARTPENAADLGIEVRKGDYNNPDDLRRSLEGVDAMLLVSGMDAPEVRIQQHRNVIEAAKSAGVRKIVYTSIQGAEQGTFFSPVVQSNRQTEDDVINSGLAWAIGRNGIYIEPDIEYLENYTRLGAIRNSAGEGKCGYTTRTELAYAYAKLLTEDKLNGQIYHLNGPAITQSELTSYFNKAFGLNLEYIALSDEEYKKERQAELGEFLGAVIAGIYQGIRLGALDNASDYARVTGREHLSWDQYFSTLDKP